MRIRSFFAALLLVLAGPAVAAVSTSSSSAGPYVCNGGTVAFAVPFPYQDRAHLVVTRSTGAVLTLGADYTVAPPKGASGTVTLTAGSKCPTGTLSITRDVQLDQPTVLPTQGPYSAKTHEAALDRIVMQAQQIERKRAELAATHAADKAAAAAQRSADLAAQSSRDSSQDGAIVTGDAATVSLLASNLAAIAAGGAPGVAASNSTVVPTGGAASRPLKDHLGDRINVRDLCGSNAADATQPGGVGTAWVGTNNAGCIQAAIDLSKPTDTGSHHEGRCVYFPRGNYGVSSPVRVYTGTCLIGDGPGSTIVALDNFSGTGVLKGDDLGTVDGYTNYIRIRELGVHGNQLGLWALDLGEGTVDGVGWLSIDGFTFWTNKGLKLDAYTQGANVRRVNSLGPVDQFLILEGNWNTFESLDKEGSIEGHTGATVDPYFLVRRTTASGLSSDSNSFKHILIEQVCSSNKSLFVADGTYNLSLHDIWFECTASDGYALRLDDSADFQITGNLSLLYTDIESGNGHEQKIDVTGGSWGSIATANMNAVDDQWGEILTVDASSYVHIGTAYTRRGLNLRPHDKGGVRFGRHYSGTEINGTIPGIIAGGEFAEARPENLLVNGSFEAGALGWYEYGYGPGTPFQYAHAWVASEVDNGRMLHVHSRADGVSGIQQDVTIPAIWVGRAMTFTFLARSFGGSNIYINPKVECPGGTTVSANAVQPIGPGAGWHTVSVTFAPLAAGTCTVGAWIYGTLTGGAQAYLDGFRLGFGKGGHAAGGSFQDLQLSQRTITMATEAPASGTWVKGSIVFNSLPDTGEPSFWQCTADGAPGTWKAGPLVP